MIAPVDWVAIRGSRFVHEDGCWHTCNGGFCCSNGHPDLQFQLIPTRGTTLLYMEDEYEFLDRQGAVPERRAHMLPPQRLALEWGGPRPLTLVQTPCWLLGKCDGVIDKPLLCRLYPFLPILDVEGRLEDVQPASIFELTFDLIGAPTPCTVRAKRDAYFERWSRSQDLELLRHPYIILHLQAAKHFARIYSERLARNAKVADLTGPAFWKAWEMQYLGRRLMDAAELARSVLATHAQLVARHGDFLRPGDGSEGA